MLFGLAGKASAQLLPDVPDMKGKFVVGGNLGGGMYGNHLNVSIAPQFGYRIFSPWEVGVRGVYDLSCDFNRVYGSTKPIISAWHLIPIVRCTRDSSSMSRMR